ncbi:hypothetical protein [Treponema pectinovorum]
MAQKDDKTMNFQTDFVVFQKKCSVSRIKSCVITANERRNDFSKNKGFV